MEELTTREDVLRVLVKAAHRGLGLGPVGS